MTRISALNRALSQPAWRSKSGRPQQYTKTIRHFASQPKKETTATYVKTLLPVATMVFVFAAWKVSDLYLTDSLVGKKDDLRNQMLEYHKQDLEQESVLLYCVIRRVDERNMVHCLTGAKVGDVVEILKEGVGPERQFNLCRLPSGAASIRKDVVGWFPTKWLQPLDEYNRVANGEEPSQQQKKEKDDK